MALLYTLLKLARYHYSFLISRFYCFHKLWINNTEKWYLDTVCPKKNDHIPAQMQIHLLDFMIFLPPFGRGWWGRSRYIYLFSQIRHSTTNSLFLVLCPCIKTKWRKHSDLPQIKHVVLSYYFLLLCLRTINMPFPR